LDPGQIFDVHYDRELPSRCGVSNLTIPLLVLRCSKNAQDDEVLTFYPTNDQRFPTGMDANRGIKFRALLRQYGLI
ncbi:MAG: hypothetical protein DCO97_15880, partial [Marivita sp. XM-24bin2]|uniref:hypothetical protein n=1 Tax=Marivita sp. XM-24bin2 TaxID=2133951 RepID=UPI000D79121C